MKLICCMALGALVFLGGCTSWDRPYVDNDGICDEIVDSRERIDCHERAEQVEDDWREEKRREAEKKEDY